MPVALVSFLGTASLYRRQVLLDLIKAYIPVAIYGKDWNDEIIIEPIVRDFEKTYKDIYYYVWPRLVGEGFLGMLESLRRRICSKQYEALQLPTNNLYGFLPTEQINGLFKKTKINIGFTRIIGENHPLRGKCQMRLRDFEVPMAGGFYLVQKSPGYEQHFCYNSEVVTWSSSGESLENVNYYLEHDKERESIALAGYQRAIKNHTWSVRFADFFCELRNEVIR